MPTCCVAAGGNIGDVAATFRQVWQILEQTPGIDRVIASRPYQTIPVGENAGDVFLNGAYRFESTLPATVILNHLRTIEEQFGRSRSLAWGPRTIDLDLVIYGEDVIQLPQLSVPHPAAWYRRFVLDPMAEIAGELVHPVHRVTFRRLQERLLELPLKVALGPLAEESEDKLSDLRWQLQQEFPQVQLMELSEASTADLILAGRVDVLETLGARLIGTTSTRLVDTAQRPVRTLAEVRHVLLSATDSPQPLEPVCE